MERASSRMNGNVRILLVDDHRMMREGLRALLVGTENLEIVGEAGDGREALAKVGSLDPDIVVMDVGMPDLNGVDATGRIRSAHPRVRVLALSTHSDERFVARMLEAGASGYVLKNAAHAELVQAIQAVSAGKTYLSPEIAGVVVDRWTRKSSPASASAYATLGAREREVLQLVAEGLTSGQVASRLHISIRTVETHRRNIAQKLGLHSTAELTKYAVREGLTSLDD